MASTILSFSSSPSFLASNRAGSSPLRSISGPCSVFLPSRPAKLSALRAQAEGSAGTLPPTTQQSADEGSAGTQQSADEGSAGTVALDIPPLGKSLNVPTVSANGRTDALDMNSFGQSINMSTVSAIGSTAALDMNSFGVYVKDEWSEIKIWVVMPGLSKDDMTVSDDHGFVYVGGEQKKNEGGAQGSWMGKSNISYHTELNLPDNCKTVYADLNDGFVLISSPKTEERKKLDIVIQ